MKGRSNLSGSSYIQFERHNMTRHGEQELPETDSYIIYNDLTTNDSCGVHKKENRGIAKIIKYYTSIVLVENYISPQCITRSCLRITDINIGLIRYKILKDYVYTCKYNYEDLDLKQLHPDIVELLK